MPSRHQGSDSGLNMTVSIIVAVAKNGVIGRENDLPWHLSEDLKHFKKTTMGKPVIMGRKTFESVGEPLPGRENIVVTRNRSYSAIGCDVALSLEEAIEKAGEVEEVMILGGGQIYKEALPLTDRIYLTQVEAQVEGDARFPELDWSEWKELRRWDHPADAKNDYPCIFMVLERISSG